MMEVVFSDSACGSLKVAQHYGEGPYVGGCCSVIVMHDDGREATAEEIETARREFEERERRGWENATSLGGDPTDVIGFSLGLSMGDISEEMPGGKRLAALRTIYSVFSDSEMEDWLVRSIEEVPVMLDKIAERLSTGEPLRVWYSDQPEELCGFYWLMAWLDKLHLPDGIVTEVRMPRFVEKEGGSYVCRNGWGDVSAEEWSDYLPLEEPISRSAVRFYAYCWKTLQSENAPLRAVVNGQLRSVPVDFYDGFIREALAAQPVEFQEARAIGTVLGKYQLGIGDSFVAGRIEEMIRCGELEAVTEPPTDGPGYHRILRKKS